MEYITSSEFYLWKKTASCKNSWDRKFLNSDFLRYEEKRIKDVSDWYSRFLNQLYQSNSNDEVKVFVLEIGQLDSDLLASIALKGNYNYYGISALRNDIQNPLIILIPQTKKQPTLNSLIRITSYKKDYLDVGRTNRPRRILIVEEFIEEDPISIYQDIPFERRPIRKFIYENIIKDDLLPQSFQPLISSSPAIINKSGGISMSAFVNKDPLSFELIKTFKLMQPPEFSNISLMLPNRLQQGTLVEVEEGVKFKISETNYVGKNYFNGLSTQNYNVFNNELNKRQLFNGEYSVIGVLNAQGDNKSEIFRDAFAKFVTTEISLPRNTLELRDYDITLKTAQKNINEDLWLQIVNQREIIPKLDLNSQNVLTLAREINEEWQINFKNKNLVKSEHEIKLLSKKSFDNIINVAKSFARDEQIVDINDAILNRSRKLFTTNMEGFIDDEVINRLAYSAPKKQEDLKINAILAELRDKRMLNVVQLYENIKNLVKDVYELQTILDNLKRRGDIFEPKQGYYVVI